MSNAELILYFNEAISLLEVAGPNPLLIETKEYYERLHTLRKNLGLDEDEQEEES